MGRRRLILALAALAPLAAAPVYTWVDEGGVTHMADDPAAVPPGALEGREGLVDLWADGPQGPLPAAVSGAGASGARGLAASRSRRIVEGAVADLARGETARASSALESVLRSDPRLPEPHWYLALLDRDRGRYASAEQHLQAFLGLAGDAYDPWRRAAQARLAALADERRLAEDAGRAADFVDVAHPHFRIRFDSALGRAEPAYGATVARFLEEARDAVGARLGTVPEEPMGVVLYGRGAYLRAHRHRFSFQTVGFYDGRIHVVSAAHPEGELRALLFHEYTHAVFREQTGGDRPYWLNEGMAELCERAARGRTSLTRSERSALSQRIDAGTWIALRRIAPSFSGLADDDARIAYLEAAAAAQWIAERTSPAERGRILRALGEGRGADAALASVLHLETEGLDRELRRAIRAGFPPVGAASAAK